MLGWKAQTALWRVLAGALLVALCPGEPAGRPRRSPGPSAEQLTGQWLWSTTDRERFAVARATMPDLVPGVLVGTVLLAADGGLVLRRGLSPRGTSESVALVVRLDDRVHAVWGRSSPGEVAQSLLPLLGGVLDDARRTGATPRELQLDYDCPESRLADWAFVVGELARSTEVPLWITSIPSHLEQRRYGELFAGRVAGHVIQLFDTGLVCSHSNARHVAERVAAAGLPFRVGVAAFERVGRASEHACWRQAVGELSHVPGYSGQWVFPGGEDVSVALADVSPRSAP